MASDSTDIHFFNLGQSRFDWIKFGLREVRWLIWTSFLNILMELNFTVFVLQRTSPIFPLQVPCGLCMIRLTFEKLENFSCIFFPFKSVKYSGRIVKLFKMVVGKRFKTWSERKNVTWICQACSEMTGLRRALMKSTLVKKWLNLLLLLQAVSTVIFVIRLSGSNFHSKWMK